MLDGRVLIRLMLLISNIINNGYFNYYGRSDETSDKYNMSLLLNQYYHTGFSARDLYRRLKNM